MNPWNVLEEVSGDRNDYTWKKIVNTGIKTRGKSPFKNPNLKSDQISNFRYFQ